MCYIKSGADEIQFFIVNFILRLKLFRKETRQENFYKKLENLFRVDTKSPLDGDILVIKIKKIAPPVRLAKANDLNKFLFELVVQFYRGHRLQELNIVQYKENANE